MVDHHLRVRPGTGTGTLSIISLRRTNSSAQRTGVISASGQTFTVSPGRRALSSLNITAASHSRSPYQIGGATPQRRKPSTLAIRSSSQLNFTATAASAGNWLFVSPASGTTSAALSVFVDPSGLGAGTYSGSVTVSSPGSVNGSQTEVVTLTVSGGPVVTITPNALSFSYQQGGSASPAQTLVGRGRRRHRILGIGIERRQLAGGKSRELDDARLSLTVSVSPAALAPGTYSVERPGFPRPAGIRLSR